MCSSIYLAGIYFSIAFLVASMTGIVKICFILVIFCYSQTVNFMLSGGSFMTLCLP